MTTISRSLVLIACFAAASGCRTNDSNKLSAVEMERELGLSLEASIQNGKNALDTVTDGIDSVRRAGDRGTPTNQAIVKVSPEMLNTLEANIGKLRDTMLDLYTKLDNPNARPDKFFDAVPREVFEDVVVRNLWRLISDADGERGAQAGLLEQIESEILTYKKALEAHRASPGAGKVDLEAPRRKLVNVAEQGLVAANVVLHEISTWRYREQTATGDTKILTTFCAGKEAAVNDEARDDIKQQCGPDGAMPTLLKAFATPAEPGPSVEFDQYSVPEFKQMRTGVFDGRVAYHSWPEIVLHVDGKKGQIVTEAGPEIRVTERGAINGNSALSNALNKWGASCREKLTRLAREPRKTETRYLAAAVCMAPETDCADDACTQVTAHSRILYYYLSGLDKSASH